MITSFHSYSLTDNWCDMEKLKENYLDKFSDGGGESFW